jgi:Phage integrase family
VHFSHSAGAVERLEALERSTPKILTSYWDAPLIERLLSTPRQWAIAQRFFPGCAGTEWRVWATDRPNHWIVSYRGFHFHVMNRIGSSIEPRFESIQGRIADTEGANAALPAGHMIRLRAGYYNDNAGAYVWYVDYLVPQGEQPALGPDEIRAGLGHDSVLEDGQIHDFDVMVHAVFLDSDHYDKDHYDFYDPYLRQFEVGAEPRKEAAYFENHELPRLFAHLSSEPYRTLFLVALKTGMRQGELLGLCWGDVDLEEAVIRVRASYTGGVVGTPKNRERRDVDLISDVVALLSDWGDRQSHSIDGLVFAGTNGQPFLSPTVVLRRHLYPAMAAAEIPRGGPTLEKRTFHSFRHTFAKRALQNGAQITWLATSATRRSK